MFIPSHLQRTKYGIFHFRLAVPPDLRCLIGKREIKKSLETGVQSEAIRKSYKLKASTEALFERLRGNLMLTNVSKDLDLSLPGNREKILAYEYSKKFYPLHVKRLRFGSLPLETIQDEDKFPKALVEVYLVPTADDWFQEMLEAHQLRTHGKPVILNIFKHEFLAMYQRFTKDAQKDFLANTAPSFTPPRLNALKPEHADLIQKDAVQPSKGNIRLLERPKEANETPPILLSELIDKFLSEKTRDKSWTENTRKEVESIFSLVIKIIQDVPVGSIGHKQARDLKETLLKLPKNMDKSPPYRSKTIEEVLRMNPSGTMSVKTINKKIGLLSSLFLYGEKHGYVDKNYFAGLCLKEKGKASENRQTFDNGDLKKLFSSSIFTGKKPKSMYQYWLPLIALYTGARLEEMAQLHLEDIREEKGIWVFDINQKGDKRVKNDHSVRLIPIHSKLIELGFLDFVESLRNKKVARAFPELSQTQNKYGHYVSRWFGVYRKKCGVVEDGKVFHSFRHTVLNCFKQKGVEREQAEAISGHGDTSISYGTYGKAYEITTLKGVIEVLNFDDALKDVIPFGK